LINCVLITPGNSKTDANDHCVANTVKHRGLPESLKMLHALINP